MAIATARVAGLASTTSVTTAVATLVTAVSAVVSTGLWAVSGNVTNLGALKMDVSRDA